MRYLRIAGLISNVAALLFTALTFLLLLGKDGFKWSFIIFSFFIFAPTLANIWKFHSQKAFTKHDRMWIHILCFLGNGLLILYGFGVSSRLNAPLREIIFATVYYSAGFCGLVSSFGFQCPRIKVAPRPQNTGESAPPCAPAFDPSLYPRSYRSATKSRIGFVLTIMCSFPLVLARGHAGLNSPAWMWWYFLRCSGCFSWSF